ncbi:tyrosine kinase family protein [Medicago truncatula]|uniref:non-specific serine/threonine protein kinase n=1 Tax=Medicago truncatula TaxID=3880 RepID=A0A072TQX6_MEDTR|nr:tyrosine kinase family protein [Medicago truncatula]
MTNLQYLHLDHNNFVGNIPSSIFNSSNLIQFQLSVNAFSGTLPNIDFGDLVLLELFHIYNNNLTIEDSHQFFTSLTNCRHLKYLDLSGNHVLPNLPKSIGNITSEFFRAQSCGIEGNIPVEVGNMSNLLLLSLYDNNINEPIPHSLKGLEKLQVLSLAYNALKGSFIDELCLIKSLGSNNLNSKIPTSLWGLTDILMLDLSSNAFIGDFPPDIGNLRELVILDLSRNQISSNIPTTISSLQNLQNLSLAHNKLNGSIPTSLGEMVSLISLDLSQNMLAGVIPKSLESLLYLQNINFSYNRLQGEIPDGGPFKNCTTQSFMHNGPLCGNIRLQVPPCGKQDNKMSMAEKILLKCILPIVVSTFLVVACIICFRLKRKRIKSTLERGLSALGALRRISYYELLKATNGFNERKLLGRGSFGSVYQGELPDGEIIAVKVFDLQSEAKSKSFDAECNAMRNLRHRNLVKIISSCSNLDFKSLVMEFMSNGSVDKWLYSNNYCLSFLQRLNIMIDVASALKYLHHGSSMPVVHCDLKPSNVMLDENMVARVSDFGIAKLMDEECGTKGIVSVKGDIYSYGIMLMEIFTRRKPTDDIFVAELSLKTWISESLPNSIMEVLDSNLVQQIGEQIDDILIYMSSIFGLALNCCEDSPEARINIADVIASLIKIKTLILSASRVYSEGIKHLSSSSRILSNINRKMTKTSNNNSLTISTEPFQREKHANQPLLLGVTGRKVIQTLPWRLDSFVEWEPLRVAAQVKLKTIDGNVLRANGGLPPWRNSVTHDIPHRSATQDWILWDVDVLEIHVGNPPPPPIPHSDSLDFGSSTPSALSFRSDRFSRQESTDSVGSPPKMEGITTYYHVAEDNGDVDDENVQGYSLVFNGNDVEQLTHKYVRGRDGT